MLDEVALRKPGWTDGYKVELADSQTWTFPKPKMRFRPKIGGDGRVEVDGGPTFGPEFDATLDVLFGVVDVEPIERLRVKFEMAVRLLRANYELTDDDVSALIVYEPDDPVSTERWNELTNACLGVAPKPSPAI